ncbi:MAG: hypothetical protein ACTHPS_28880 [Streptosporangiaceae bacterium]
MKRKLATIAGTIALAVVTLAACGGGSTSTSAAPSATPTHTLAWCADAHALADEIQGTATPDEAHLDTWATEADSVIRATNATHPATAKAALHIRVDVTDAKFDTFLGDHPVSSSTLEQFAQHAAQLGATC